VTFPNEFVQGGSPVCTGVVPRSKASGKVVWSDPCTEVSQTAVSVLTPFFNGAGWTAPKGCLWQNHIQRL